MDPVQTIIVAVIGGVLIKIAWDWVVSGRMKKGEYYRTVASCDEIRRTCNIHNITQALAKHKNIQIKEDSDIKGRLSAIESRMQEVKDEAKDLKTEVSGIRSAVDRMAAAIEIYASDRRKQDHGGGQQ